MGVMGKVLSQCRRPTGWLGRLVARGMNISHSKLTDWGLKCISIGKRFTILDIGCGGGATISKLAGIATDGKVYGIDYSGESVRISRKRNKDLIKSGRVEIQHGSVSTMPFMDNMFDLVSAIETHYFWPDLAGDMREVFRVLKRPGTFLVVGGAYKGSRNDARDRNWAKVIGMTLHTVDELGEVLREAGFFDVKMNENYQEGWVCGVCRKL